MAESPPCASCMAVNILLKIYEFIDLSAPALTAPRSLVAPQARPLRHPSISAQSPRDASAHRPCHRPQPDDLDGATARPEGPSMTVTREDVLAALATVPMPGTGGSIVDADVVRALTIEGERVRFVLEVDPAQGRALEPIRAAAEAAVAALPGVAAVSALLTAHGPAPKAAAARPQDRPPPDAAGRARRRCRASGGSSPIASRQGRRRQVDGRGQPRGGAGARGQARRPARRRHLRPEPAADDGRQRAAEVAGRQDHPAAARPRRRR